MGDYFDDIANGIINELNEDKKETAKKVENNTERKATVSPKPHTVQTNRREIKKPRTVSSKSYQPKKTTPIKSKKELKKREEAETEEKSKWKKATVSKPKKKIKKIFTVLAALSISAAVILGASKSLPDFTIPSLQNAVTNLNTAELVNSSEDQIVDEDFQIFTDGQVDEIVKTLEDEKGETNQEVGEEQGEQQVEQPSAQPTETPIEDLKEYEGQFELPMEGATGIVGNRKLVFEDEKSHEQVTLNYGQTYTILGISEDEQMFKIITQDGKIGEVSTIDAWVNLPDLIPSVIYKISNNDGALYQAKDEDIPGVTGEKLYSSSANEDLNYNCFQYNEKLGKDEYLVPATFSMAKKIQGIQQDALSNGYSLVIYEAFRPWATQQAVSNGLDAKFGGNLTNELNKGYGTNYGKSWFIATNVSNHQYGYAMDCSLAKVNNSTLGRSGEYKYSYYADGDYEILEMPSDIHELSAKSAVYKIPVNSHDKTLWQNTAYTGGWTKTFAENESAQLLQSFCTSNGLTPLSSEWWHFNDLDSEKEQKNRCDNPTPGNFAVGDCVSIDDVSKLLEQEKEEPSQVQNNNGQNNVQNNDDYER